VVSILLLLVQLIKRGHDTEAGFIYHFAINSSLHDVGVYQLLLLLSNIFTATIKNMLDLADI
jgi:hypothetical protein